MVQELVILHAPMAQLQGAISTGGATNANNGFEKDHFGKPFQVNGI
jgi:hypothetical protein